MADDFVRLTSVLFPAYVEAWSDARRRRIRGALAGAGGVLETDVTEMLAAVDGELQEKILEIMGRAVGLPDLPVDAVVLDGGYFARRFPSKSGCKHVPDLCIARVDPAGIPLELVAVIEAKGNAQVNGGWGYCAARGKSYGNQSIVYPSGCWTSADFDDVKMLWMGPDRSIGHRLGPWGTKGLVPSDIDRYGLEQAFAEQESVRGQWSGLGWGEFSDELRSHPDGELVARVIDSWSQGFR